MSSITVNGKVHAGQYGSTDQSGRIRLGDTVFHNGPLGLSAKTAAGVDMGFNREAGGTLNSMTTGGTTYYSLTDAIGSVVSPADADGNKVNSYRYSSRGVRILAQSSEPVARPYRFAGGCQDPTGPHHLRARYYDAGIGRFTQPDPSGQEQNPSLYAEGDPVNRIGPSGLPGLGSIGDGLGVATTLYEGFTGGTGAADKATAAMIADIGITGLCEAGAAAFTGPGALPALPYRMAIGAAAALASAPPARADERTDRGRRSRRCLAPAPAVSNRGNEMIQSGRRRQILLFGTLALICGALLLAISPGGPTDAFGWLLISGGTLCVPVSLISEKKGQR